MAVLVIMVQWLGYYNVSWSGRKLALNVPIFGKWEDNRAELTGDNVEDRLWFSLDMCYWITQKQVLMNHSDAGAIQSLRSRCYLITQKQVLLDHSETGAT